MKYNQRIAQLLHDFDLFQYQEHENGIVEFWGRPKGNCFGMVSVSFHVLYQIKDLTGAADLRIYGGDYNTLDDDSTLAELHKYRNDPVVYVVMEGVR